MIPSAFHPEAWDEMLDAARYYEEQEPGLGLDFLEEIEHVTAEISEHPLRWPILENDIRRKLANRFPYGILYHLHEEGFVIVAVMHLHREPGYWKSRI